MPFWRMFFNTVLVCRMHHGRAGVLLLAGRICLRTPAISRAGHVVRVVSGHADGAADRHGDPAVHPDASRSGWTDTPWAMIVPGLFGSAFGTYLMRQFFRTLPTDLEEAAILDGCSPWQIYWRILLPHARPAVMVLAVLTWVNVWNDFLWPLLMIQRNSLATLTLGPGPDAGRVRRPLAADHGDVDAHHAAAGVHLRHRATLLRPRHRRHRAQWVTP